jgi:hypothetical protein
MFMFGVFEFFIFPNFEISKLETLSNPEYQISVFKNVKKFQDFKKLRIQLFQKQMSDI